ncbi:MAG: TonB family protein [Acidobacteria bacterium]|nr:TonB family protein [Acidobacteriota bacterium]
MYLNLDGRPGDTPTIGSVMTWRDQALLSILVHVVAVLLVLLVPRLPIVQEAAARRAERQQELQEMREMAEQAELQARLLEPAQRDDQTFVFIQPRVELDPPVPPPPDAVLSDRDRVAQSPVRTLDPENRLPVSEGNTSSFIVDQEGEEEGSDEVAAEGYVDGEDDAGAEPVDQSPQPEESPEQDLAAESAGQDETEEAESEPVDDPGPVPEIDNPDRPVFADSSLADAGSGPGDPGPADAPRLDLSPDRLLGRAVENLRQRVQRETFRNYSGDTGRFGPDIQFDSKGVEFGPWIRRFVAQIRRNWFVPYAIWSMHGHVVLTFNVHSDGSLTDLTVVKPSHVEAFTNSAFNALLSSNPTQPLPPEYPDDRAFFTVTFYFNEMPPA